MKPLDTKPFAIFAVVLLLGTGILPAGAVESVPGFPRTILIYESRLRPPVIAGLGDIQLQNFDLMSVEKTEEGFCHLRLKPKNNQAPTIRFSSSDGIVKGKLAAILVRQPAYGPKEECARHWVEKPVLLYALGFDYETAFPYTYYVEFNFFQKDGICMTGDGRSEYSGYFNNCVVTAWQ